MSQQISATYLGHSCVELDFNGTKVLTDPFITYNPLASALSLESIHPDYIFLSHGHEDHVADMATIQQNSHATVAAVVETAAWVRKQGVPDEKVIEFNFGGTLDLPFGKVKMVYALHTNATPDGEYGGLPCGFVFFVDNMKIYFAGDTALTMEMKLLENLHLDYAFLPIGGHYTMDAQDALKAAELINCQNIIGIHYNTFPPITLHTEQAQLLFENAGRILHLPAIGERLVLEK